MDENKLLEAFSAMLDERDKRLYSSMDALKKELNESMNERDNRMYSSMDELKKELMDEVRQTRVLVEAQDHKLELLMEAQSETKSKFSRLDRMEQTLNEVKSDVEVIRDVVRWHSIDIQKLKEA